MLICTFKTVDNWYRFWQIKNIVFLLFKCIHRQKKEKVLGWSLDRYEYRTSSNEIHKVRGWRNAWSQYKGKCLSFSGDYKSMSIFTGIHLSPGIWISVELVQSIIGENFGTAKLPRKSKVLTLKSAHWSVKVMMKQLQ